MSSTYIDHLVTHLIAEFADGTISVRESSSTIHMGLSLIYSRAATVGGGGGQNLRSGGGSGFLSTLQNKFDVSKHWSIDFSPTNEEVLHLRGPELKGKIIEIRSQHVEVLEFLIPQTISSSSSAMKAPLVLTSATVSLHLIVPQKGKNERKNGLNNNGNSDDGDHCFFSGVGENQEMWERTIEIPVRKPDVATIYKTLMIAKEKKKSFQSSFSLLDEHKVSQPK
jgi:hypothetical protein